MGTWKDFFMETLEPMATAPVRILVIPASAGAGASFLSQVLAWQLAHLQSGEKKPAPRPAVSLIETADACFFRALGMEQPYLERRFSDVHLALEKGSPIRDLVNERDGINCLFRIPAKSPELTVPRLFRLINSSPGSVQIFDFSGLDNELLSDAAAEGEVRILVIDPLPSSLLAACDRISSFLLRFPDTILVVNKMNPGVHKRQLSSFLDRKTCCYVPYLPPEVIYKAQYCRLFAASLQDARPLLFKSVSQLLSLIDERLQQPLSRALLPSCEPSSGLSHFKKKKQ